MNDERLPYKEWIGTRCSVPFHHHDGPTKECRKLMRQLEAPNAVWCSQCHAIYVAGEDCPGCGKEWPKPLERMVPARRSLGAYESDGLGCVEKVSHADRAWMER